MALDFFAGCLGGCAGILVGHPLDTVKIRIQTQDWRNPRYKGTVDCLKAVIRQESVLGLYKGMSSPLAGVAVINALVFGVYGNIQKVIPQPDSLISNFVSGATSGAIQSFICSPMELVKARMQIDTEKTVDGPIRRLRGIAKTEGLGGVFKGLKITFFREAIGFGIYFATYEYLTRKEDSESIGVAHLLAAGGTSGAVSWLFTYPIDVIKSRIQTDGIIGEIRYKNGLDCLIKGVNTEGVHFLFRGLSPTLIRAFPTNAATWAVVTWVLNMAKSAESSRNLNAENELAEATLWNEFPPVNVYTYNFCMEHNFKLNYFLDDST